MSEKALTTIIAIIFIFVLGLTVALGISASSFWVGALAFIGVLLSLTSIGTLGNTENVNAGFYIIHLLALAALASAAWLADLQPLWMVIVLMSFAAIAPIFASDFAFKQSKGAGFLVVLLNLVSTPLAIALPAWIMNTSASVPLAPQTWAWSLAIAGLAVLAVGILQAGMMEAGPYFACLPIGLIPLIGSAFLIQFNLNWVWLLPWIAAAILIGVGGALLPRWRTKSGTIGIILAVLVLAAGVGLSLMDYGILPDLFQGKTGQPIAQSAPEGTLSAADQAATQLAAAAGTATQAILDEKQALTQTRQAQMAAQQQTQAAAITPTPTLEPTPTPAPTQTAVSIPLPGQTTAAAVEGPGFFKAVGAFLWFAIKSIWGIVYLLLLIGIGQTWIKRWGGWAFFILLLVAVGFFGGSNLSTLETMTRLVTTGPTTWWVYVLIASNNWTGTVGWGILAFLLLITVLLLPSIKISNQFSQKVLSAQGLQNNPGTTGCRESLATMIYLLASSAIPITLWVALHRVSTAPTSKFPFLFIPNLAVPNWRPVWHYSYFVLGGLFLLAYFIFLRFLRKSQPGNMFTQFGAWGAAPVSIAITLLVPGGVVLYMTVQLILMAILQPIFTLPQQEVRDMPPKPGPQPFPGPSPIIHPDPSPENKVQDAFDLYLDEIKKKALESTPDDDSGKKISENENDINKKAMETMPEGDLESPISGLESEPLSTLPTPMVGGYLKAANWLAVLDESNKLYWLVNGTRHGEVSLPVDFPLALLCGQEDHLLAVGREGKVIPVTASQTFEVSPPVEIEFGIRHAAANSYGTLLAYVPEEHPSTVHGLFVAAKRDQLFLDLGSEAISCLAFSQNARFLAAGTELGRIIVIDIATHQQILSIPDPYYGPVRMLDALDGEKWVAVYGDGWMAVWNMSGVQTGPVELSQSASSLVIAKSGSLILVGDRSGYLWGYPFDLSNLAFSKQLQDGEITQIFTAPDGTLITTGDFRDLRKSSL